MARETRSGEKAGTEEREGRKVDSVVFLAIFATFC
jgi:hypothetical protein